MSIHIPKTFANQVHIYPSQFYLTQF